mgnify:CR=1
MRRVLAVILFGLFLSGCDDGHLRGYTTASSDGRTYLAIADDHDGCALKVDGKPWPHAAGVASPVTPGAHTIACNDAEIRFTIPQGVVFHFDYWGP